MVGSYVALGPSGAVTTALVEAARCPGHCIQVRGGPLRLVSTPVGDRVGKCARVGDDRKIVRKF